MNDKIEITRRRTRYTFSQDQCSDLNVADVQACNIVIVVVHSLVGQTATPTGTDVSIKNVMVKSRKGLDSR